MSMFQIDVCRSCKYQHFELFLQDYFTSCVNQVPGEGEIEPANMSAQMLDLGFPEDEDDQPTEGEQSDLLFKSDAALLK